MTEEDGLMLRDRVIRGAALAMLNEQMCILWTAILNKLTTFLRRKKDENSVHPLNRAIRDVSGQMERRGAGRRKRNSEFIG